MTENEHLLLCLAEECDEVGQRVMKALRFGLDEIQPGQPLSNAQRISGELHDLISVATILSDNEVIPNPYPTGGVISAKAAKIAHFMEIGRREGVLTTVPETAGPVVIEAASSMPGDIFDWALTVQWPDGSESVEHCSTQAAALLGYVPE
ncbi:hypothetical protein ABEV34_28610 [Methylorubrum rhodesianum]|uniref:hypothetical protein n=1 Tax=Methylorubrum rhodesianum TaxID=29427 RepID=UPI003D2A45CB